MRLEKARARRLPRIWLCGVAAGPSAHRNHPAAVLKKSGYRGAVIATESAIFQCLQTGLVPQLIVSVDPDSHRIKRWFGDPQLPANIEDDYFRRQDLDEAFANEHEHNKKLLALLDQYGSQLRIALSSSASQAVVDRCRDIAGAQLGRGGVSEESGVSLRDVTSVGAQRSNHRRVGAAVIHAALAQLRDAAV